MGAPRHPRQQLVARIHGHHTDAGPGDSGREEYLDESESDGPDRTAGGTGGGHCPALWEEVGELYDWVRHYLGWRAVCLLKVYDLVSERTQVYGSYDPKHASSG